MHGTTHPPPADPDTGTRWHTETLAGTLGTMGTLAVPLTLGMLAFAALGPQAAAVGVPAALVTMVLGGVVYGLLGRAALPLAGPSSATALILAGLVLRLAGDPALGAGQPGDAAVILAAAGLAVLLSGLMQVALALLGLARLARFVPQPVLAGFMNGVALLVALSQLPALLGHAAGGPLAAAFTTWQPLALLLGAATIAVVWGLGRRVTRAPPALVALLLGTAAYHALQVLAPGSAAGQAVGTLPYALPGPDILRPLFAGSGLDLLRSQGGAVAVTALALALVGAMESALNTLAVDRVRNTRHDPSRELLAIGLTNLACGAIGGLPAVALRARANATLQAGGRSAVAAVGGSLVVGALILMGGGDGWLAWLPLPVLAGIMLTVAFGLLDRWTHGLLVQWWSGERTRDMGISLGLVALVCVVTVWQGFVVAVTVGVLLSMLVFVARMNRSLVRSRYTADARPSRRVYPAPVETLLQPLRSQVLVLELEGALFFGSSEGLLTEALDSPCRCLVLDLHRVGNVDETGAFALLQLRAHMQRRGVTLRLCGVSPETPRGRALRAFSATVELCPDVDRAVEAAERQLLGPGADAALAPVALADCTLLQGVAGDALERVCAGMRARRLRAGEMLFAQGEAGDSLFVLTEGSVSVVSAAQPGVPQQRYLSLSPGMMFGETAMLDGRGRSAAVVADSDAVVHELARAELDALDAEQPQLASRLYRNIALHLSQRLRSAAAAWHASTR